MMRRPGLSRWLVGAPPLAYLLFFFAAPLLIMLVASFRAPGEFGGLAPILLQEDGGTRLNLTTEAYERFFSDTLYLRLFAKSLAYAALAAALCLAAGYPLALLIARISHGLAANVWVWAVAGLGGLSNEASRNAKADQVVTVHRGQTL